MWIDGESDFAEDTAPAQVTRGTAASALAALPLTIAVTYAANLGILSGAVAWLAYFIGAAVAFYPIQSLVGVIEDDRDYRFLGWGRAISILFWPPILVVLAVYAPAFLFFCWVFRHSDWRGS